jgi:rubrerythrin
MKTITQFVRQGIKDPTELKDALRTAMRLEFSTIPPYLCAEWSIKAAEDLDKVRAKIKGIVIQEMYHFALAGNMLSAIGGTPTDQLPGGIHQDLPVDLQPLSEDQLAVFMQIEKPEFPPVEIAAQLAVAPATIGEFYTALSTAFQTLTLVIDQNAHAIELPPNVFRINSIDDARRAIDKIKGEGEGAPGNPDQPANPDQLAHFYVFEEISVGNELTFDPATKKLVPIVGKPLRFPDVFPFAPSTATPNPSTTFNTLLKQLLTDLEACWTTGANFGDAARPDMDDLRAEGLSLISRGIRPEFVWPA